MTKDWRLENLELTPRLQGVHFIRKSYSIYQPGWDHDHCKACLATITKPEIAVGEDVVHEGYATTDAYSHGANYVWVCVACFKLFASAMNWVDETPKLH